MGATNKNSPQNILDFPKIFHHLPLCVMIFDKAGKFIYWNPAAKDIWLQEPPKEYSLFEDPNIQAEGLHEKAMSLSDGDPLPPKEYWINLHDVNPQLPDSPVYLKSYGYVIKNENNDLEFIVSIHEDKTEQKQAEKNRHKTEERFLRSQKMEAIGQLAGGIAHDFNNQLTGIIGCADILKESLSDNPDLHELSEIIVQSAERCSNLTNQLLAFARKGKYKSTNVNIHTIIGDVFSILEMSVHKKIIIHRDLEAKIPITRGDPNQINSVFLNLTRNAADAMPYGGDLTLTTKNVHFKEDDMNGIALGLNPGHYIIVSIGDTGLGLDKETLRRIFEPFFTTKEMGQATGMGLSASYGIIKNHAGSIDVTSTKGKGTTFDIYLPVTQETEYAKKQDLSGEVPVEFAEVLLVDDEQIVLDTSANMLKLAGYNVTKCRNSREAVEIYRKSHKKFDIVLLDMLMPDLDGLETFLEMRSINPNIKVLFLSGYSIDESVQKIVDEGMAEYIQKPFTKDVLLKRVSTILRQ